MFPQILAAFPTPNAVASSSIHEVEKYLRPAGLLHRGAQLHEAASLIVREHGGCVPNDERSLQTLPGVGPYVAGAVVSTTSRRKVALVDTNTVRVAMRVAGIAIEAKDIRRQRVVVAAVEELLGGPATGRDWWAVIDLAALVCRPTTPECSNCPLTALCATGRTALPNSVSAGRYDPPQ